MKKHILLMLCLMFGLVSMAIAEEPIGVFANNNTNSLQLINPITQQVSDSVLKGSLGSYGGGLFDVVITSNGKTAIVSNFGDSKIFFVDISGGFNGTPTLLGSVKIPFFAEDMVITPNDQYVLVTDGGFSPRIAVVDVAGRFLAVDNKFGAVSSQAVDIAPDGETVLTVDYFAGKVNVFKLQTDGVISHIKSIYIMPLRPVNIAISPDGKTAIAVSANTYYAAAFSIIDGDVNLTGLVTLPTKSGQSCVFSKDGTKAYYMSNSITKRAMINVLDVTSPGQVTASSVSIPVRPLRGTSQLFGVDTIAIDPAGYYLYVANPTVSGGTARVSVVDLTSNAQVGYIQAHGIPTGIAFATIQD